MRLARDEGRWRGPEFAAAGGRKGGLESTACPLDVARDCNDGVSFFFPTRSLVDLQREFRRSRKGAKLRRRCFWRGCLFARTCKLSTLARSLANCHRSCTGFFRQELMTSDCSLEGNALRYSPPLQIHEEAADTLGILELLALSAPFRICELLIPLAGSHKIRQKALQQFFTLGCDQHPFTAPIRLLLSASIFVDHLQQLVIHCLPLFRRPGTNGVGSTVREVIAHECSSDGSERFLR